MKRETGYVLVFVALIATLSGSIVLDRIVVGGIFLLCVFWGSRESSFLNPFNLFAVTPLSLLSYVNISDYYMVDLTPRTWGLAIINMTAFLIALRYSHDFCAWRTCKGPSNNRLALHAIILTVLSLISSGFEYALGRPFFLASILKLLSIPAIICALKSKNKVLIISIVSILVLSSIGFLSKTDLLFYLLAFLIGIEKYYIHNARQKKRMVIYAFIGIVLMILSFSFANKDRESRSSSEIVDYYAEYGDVEWRNSNVFFMPYMYLTTPWANLQYLTETQNERTYGLWLLKPIINYCQLDHLFEDQYRLRSYSSFNTFTFIAYNFKDFGYWLSVLSSVLLGIFVKRIYTRYKGSRSPLDAACYAGTSVAVLEMFFSNEFFSQSFPFTLVIILMLYKFICFFNSQAQLELQ